MERTTFFLQALRRELLQLQLAAVGQITVLVATAGLQYELDQSCKRLGKLSTVRCGAQKFTGYTGCCQG